MKTIRLTIVLFLSSALTIYSQGTKLESLKAVDIDTLSYLKIDKVIYYKNPIELEYHVLTDTTFIPAWYNAYCVNSNIEHFTDYTKDAIKYFHKDMGVTKSMLQNYYNEVKASGGTKDRIKSNEKFLFNSYLYIYGEIWLTLKKTGEQYVLIKGLNSVNRIKNLRFNQSVKEKNLKNERTDSIKNPVNSYLVFINSNDTLKLVDQFHVLNNVLTNGRKYSIGGDLANFKDILYRTPIYIQSEAINGKRIFETMEKRKDGHKKIKESNIP